MPFRNPALRVLTAIFSVLLARAGFNPETGSFVFQVYPAKVYGAHPQNWAAVQDSEGILYFGNTEGLLEFDGVFWRTIQIPNKFPAVRSLALDEKGRVFVGGIGEFGYLEKDGAGTLKYVSLTPRLPESDRQFGDVWTTLARPEGVYFGSFARLFRLNTDGTIHVWRPATAFGLAYAAGDSIYLKTPEQGLLRLQDDRFTPVAGGAVFRSDNLRGSVTLDGKIYVATSSRFYRLTGSGVEPVKTPSDAVFAKDFIQSLLPWHDQEILVGTRRGGLLIVDLNRGVIDRAISKSDGLPDDYVSSIYRDRQGGIWLTNNSGIARFNSGLSLFDQHGLQGEVQTVARQKAIYVGTLAGLFRLDPQPLQPPRFERVEGIDDAVRTILPRSDDLLVCTDHGVFLVQGTMGRRILETHETVWDIAPSLRDPHVVYAAGRDGVIVLREAAGEWSKSAQISPPGQEFHSILEDADGRVWATTVGGIWRFDFRDNPVRVEQFGRDRNVPSNWINARRLGGHVVFTTEKGLRRYSEQVKRFAPDVTLGDEWATGGRNIGNLFEDSSGVWLTGPGYNGHLRRTSAGYRWEMMPLLPAGIREIFWMSADEDGTVWATTNDDGKLKRWDPALNGNPDRDFRVWTRQITATASKRVLYGGAGPFPSGRLPYGSNALRFEFAAPFYEDPASVEYQARLEGNDDEWSPWSHETRRDYTNLGEGTYTFHVRARSPHGAVNEQATIVFGILPPWYRTWWAYLIYTLVGAYAVYSIVRLRTRQLEADKRRLETIVEERTVEIRQQRDEIQVQERKAHSLLLNILPARVADELKATGAVKPMGFDEVTVCFTDFVGFTVSSEKMQPGRLVDALNEYFTAFDEIMARYGLEKLKTIGDSYMFASGLPVRRASHAVDAALAAIEMVEVVRKLGVKAGGTGWNIRVGMHSGPVIAGVVGIRKFAFDIWGNTVNFASRMESSGVHGRVNMSEHTHALLRDFIDCEARGMVKIKEGRELPMYLAVGPTAAFADKYRAAFGENPRSLPAEPALEAQAAVTA